MYLYIYYVIEIFRAFQNISFQFDIVFALPMLDGGGMMIKFCSGFFNLLYRRYPPIANLNTLRPPTYTYVFVSGLGLCSILSCFVICSFNVLALPFYGSYIQPISFLVQFSEGFSVSLQFPVSGDSQFLLYLPFNLVTEFFA